MTWEWDNTTWPPHLVNLSHSTAFTCDEWGWEPKADDPRPKQKVYPVRHGPECEGHWELMPSLDIQDRERPPNRRQWWNVDASDEYL